MEDQQTINLDTEHRRFAEEVISEHDLCVLLGVSGQTVDNLRRNNGLPVCYLNKRNRVYFTSDVLKWLGERAKT